MILTDKNTFQSLSLLAEENIYGYSANRQWVEEGWFEKNIVEIKRAFINQDEEIVLKLSEPTPNVRNKKNNRHLLRTYIGNFGFIHKSALIEVGGWDESYEGYGCEDDDLALRLYLQYGKPAILKEITVAHVWHRIFEKNYEQLEKNKNLFNSKLMNFGIAVFHVGRLMYEEDEIIEFIK